MSRVTECACGHDVLLHVQMGHAWACLAKPSSPEEACPCEHCKDAAEEGAEPYCRCRRFRPVEETTRPERPAEATT